MDTYIGNLYRSISRPRLEPFRPDDGNDLAMIANYLWNLELCQAIYPALHGCEVALRNSIHAAASAHYGTPYWFD